MQMFHTGITALLLFFSFDSLPPQHHGGTFFLQATADSDVNNLDVTIQELTPTSSSPVEEKQNKDDTDDEEMDPVERMFQEETTRGYCDLPVIEGILSGREFRQKYWNKSPVIIRGMAKEWPAIENWTKEYLIEKFGNIETQIGTSNGIIKAGGTGNQYVNFGDYVEKVWGDDAKYLGDGMPNFDEIIECRTDAQCIAECHEEGIASIEVCGMQICNDDNKCINRASLMQTNALAPPEGIDKVGDNNNSTNSDNTEKKNKGYGEVPYLFDRENFMNEAIKKGITMDLRTPSFFRSSELSSKTYKSLFESKMTREQHMERERKEAQKQEEQGGGDDQSNGRKRNKDDGKPGVSQTYIFLTPKFNKLVGVGMHQHTDGWNAHLGGDGVKLWFIYPPAVKPGPEHPVTRPWCCGEDSWIRVVLPTLMDRTKIEHGPGNLKPLMCTQKTGDIVYIPEWWHHATLSGPGPEGIGGLVGVASQLGDPSGDLHLNYEARTAEREFNNKTWARKLLREHIRLNVASSGASAKQLLQSLVQDMETLERNGTDPKEIIAQPEFQEGKDLLAHSMQMNPGDDSMVSLACSYALLENDTKTALVHMKSGKLLHIFFE